MDENMCARTSVHVEVFTCGCMDLCVYNHYCTVCVQKSLCISVNFWNDPCTFICVNECTLVLFLVCMT